MAKSKARTSREDYRKESLPERTKANKVFMWRTRIEQAKEMLCIPGRIENARTSNSYLSGLKQPSVNGPADQKARIFMNHGLPLLEETHRGSIPEMPTPMVAATTQAAAGENNQREKTVQQFTNLMFDQNKNTILGVIEQMQWDDDKFGAAIVRADWVQETIDSNPMSDISQENFNVQIQRATEENMSVDQRAISQSDMDIAHIRTHEEYMQTIPAEEEEYESIKRHVMEHRSRLQVVNKEGVRIARIAPENYLYDWKHGWGERGWEMEKKSARVKHLLDNGYKNVNPENAPAESQLNSELLENGVLSYEDQTISIWEIHDRMNQMEYVISADGPSDGDFLMERPWRYGNVDIYKLITFHPFNPDQSWGVPIMQAMIPILERLAVVEYYIDRHVQNHPSSKIFVPSTAGVDKIKRALKDPNTMMVPVTPEAAAMIKIFDPPAIPRTDLEYRSILKDMLRDITGLSAQDTGSANPHKLSATETNTRSVNRGGRIEDRQMLITDVLSWIGGMFLQLYKDFAMMAIEVKVHGDMGEEWTHIQPRDLPTDIGISFEMDSRTDKMRAERIARVERVVNTVRTSFVPHDDEALTTWALKEYGVKNPEQFRMPGPLGPQNVQGADGMPGVAGSGMAPPVGTPENSAANKAAAPTKEAAEVRNEQQGETR